MGDLLVKGGTVVTAERTFRGDIVIRNGRIVEMIEPSGHAGADVARAAEGVAESVAGDADPVGNADMPVLDATSKYVLPGLIDVHVHLRDPGLTHKEDFITGTLAAACGGVTTVLDMPNTIPPVATADIWRAKAAVVAGRAHVDYGIYGLIDEHNLDELTSMAEAGAIGFKLFLGPTTGDLRAPGWGRLIEVFEWVRDIGLPLVIHAEDRDVIEYWQAKVEAGWRPDGSGATDSAFDYAAFLATRPRFGEVAAIQTVCLLARMTNTPIHIAHVTLAEAVDVIRQAKAAGAPVTAETCPPYLTMTEADCERLGPVSKILPPIRSAADRDALWAGLHDGAIDLIATDHAPHEGAAKDGHGWLTAAGGMTGVETMLTVLLNEVHRGRLTLSELVRWTSVRPAHVFGMADCKGDLRPGLDADLVVVDPEADCVVDAESLHSKSDNSPLIGQTLRGAVVHTVLRGRVVVENGQPVGRPKGEPIGKPVGRLRGKLPTRK